MRKLYLLSKPFNNQPRLIGILSELKEGNDEREGDYQFEYKLGGVLPEYFLMVEEFPDIKKIYRGNEVRHFLNRVLPERDAIFINEICENAKINEYKEWELLKYCGQLLCEDETSLCEHLPEGVIVYESMEAV